MTLTLTIITITYNADRYLDRTLASVRHALAQVADPSVVEYLIVDGKSTDDTLEIAKNYSDVITKLVSEPDQGLYNAMNKGQRLASGKYIWFLNAGDEVYDRDVIVKLLRALESQDDVYYSDAMFVRQNGEQVGLRSRFTPHSLSQNITWRDFSLGMKICHQAFIAKREIATLYDEGNLSADIDWEILCLKKANNAIFLPFVLCKYLLGGVSVQNHRRSLTDRFEVLRKHFGFIPTLLNHILIFWRGFWFAKKNGKYW
jgi:glycosyltransferase involved in cell wall biosynthesis